MNIETAAKFVGPNVYSKRPIIRYRIDGAKRRRRLEIDDRRRELLFRLLPNLDAAAESCGAAGLAAREDFDRGLPFGHAVEHVAVALQNQVGAELTCVRSGQSARINSRAAIVAYEEAEVCEAAVHLAFDLLERLASLDEAKVESITDEFEPRIESFLSSASRRMLPVQDRAFVRAARERDVPVYRIAGRMIQLGQGCFQSRVSATKTTMTNVVSNDLAANKDFSRRILGGLGLPIPDYERVYRKKDAIRAADRIGYPVVVKPNQGNMGQAVSVGMLSALDVGEAYTRAREVDRSILVEELIDGDDFRILVINGEYCAASKRTPGHVVGDGVSSVEELVVQLNADPRRGSGPRSPWTRIEFDEQADRLLAARDMTRTTIPLEGEIVYLRRNANTSDGGTAMDVTDSVHPDNREIAIRAAKGIGLDIAGVDFLTTDISRSMWKTGGVICEINSRPGLRKHMWPANGPARDIMTPIVDMLYPESGTGRVPVVGLLGIDKRMARAAARRLAELLGASGRRVGLATDHRVSIDGRRRRTGRMTAPEAAQAIMLDPEVEVAVLELTVNDVVRDGLGCDAFDLSVIVSNERPEEIQPAAVEGGVGVGTEDPEPALPALSDKVLDAVRVMVQATRETLLVEGDERLAAAVASAAGPETKLKSIADDSPPTPEAGVTGDVKTGLTEDQRASAHAERIASGLGLSGKEIRRALRKLDPDRRRRKARSRKGKRTQTSAPD